MTLSDLLYQKFGFTSFRPNQEAVCQAATDGRDVLLVMPTGAGKSLCYQLPALARGGCALVISPLIALMDDQAKKLADAGHAVARIHSGMSREDSRLACRDYLEGRLSFLFIAPERLRVRGFPEMLARRKPSLIAIDEAHCISAWGHDFRPDYRTLGDHLPALRPAPVIALTATATPAVQRDIVAQLSLRDPDLFIHGFRRDNLAIDAREIPKAKRNAFIADFLGREGTRPAIVYTPSRKTAEEIAKLLGGRAAAYHAGLDGATRERVQRHFLAGELEVVVATIAFGMGIDKADVRTVIHAALPGSVEAYYQEIGRAGRDGLPSRAVLLYSFADRKLHDFFLDRDYPAASELTRIQAALGAASEDVSVLGRRLKIDAEVVQRALERLVNQGVAAVDAEGRVCASPGTSWRSAYEAQIEFRRSQIDRIAAFAEGRECRMTALIRHFGDADDARRSCGRCDVCAPESSAVQEFRSATAQEQEWFRRIFRALERGGRSTGKLFSDLAILKDRGKFESLLEALARAGYLTLSNESFLSEDGRHLRYKKAALTHEGLHPDSGALAVTVRAEEESSPRQPRDRTRPRPADGGDAVPLTPDQKSCEERLRAWRSAEAAATGKPTFLVFADKVLRAIAVASPVSLAELRKVSGVGPEKQERYGAEVLRVLRGKEPQGGGADHPRRTGERPEESRRSASAGSQSLPEKVAPRESAAKSVAPMVASRMPEEKGLTPAQSAMETRLREWRRSASERTGMPQFYVLDAATLRQLVLLQPRSSEELLTIRGFTPEKMDLFGREILKLCAETSLLSDRVG